MRLKCISQSILESTLTMRIDVPSYLINVVGIDVNASIVHHVVLKPKNEALKTVL